MPVGMSGDFVLNGKPYLLARGERRGRAWKRFSRPNAVQPRRTDADAQRGSQPPEIDFVSAYDDFSGGYGYAYRQGETPNTVHWSENFDLRWPNQAVHCQQLQLLPARYASLNTKVEYLIDAPVPSGANQPAGAGVVLVTGHEFVGRLGPTGLMTAGSQFDTALEFTPTLEMRSQAAIAENFTYIPSSTGFIRRTHNAAYTQSDAISARAFITAGNRLWRTHTTFKLQSISIGADATNTANWSATLNIGNQSDLVNDMIELGDQVFCATPEGLFAGDISGTFFNVLSQVRSSRHIDNGHDLTIYDNGVIMPHAAGVFWYEPSDVVANAREIGPQARSSDRSPVQGRIRTVRAHGPWLYGGLWTGSQSFIQAARKMPSGEYRWHILNRLPHAARINRMHFDTITNASSNQSISVTEIPTRMWVATDWLLTTGTSALYVAPIPRLNGNPLANDPIFSANYVGSARMDLGRDDQGAPDTLKVYRRLDISTEANTLLSGVNYADVYFAVDGGSRTLLGRAQTSPKTTLFFPSTQGSFLSGYNLELSAESFCGTAGLSPVYLSFALHGAFRPDSADEIHAVVHIGDNLRDRTSGLMRPGRVMLSELRALADPTQQAQPVMLSDPTGAVHWVAVQPGIQEEELYQEGSDEPEIAASVRMTVMRFS